jgi:TolA-binding protein
MKKLIILSLLIAYSNADVSAFEAGNLDSSNPYGLTKDEKYILKNKKEIEKLKAIVQSQTKIINSQEKDIDNLRTKLFEYTQKFDNLTQKIEGITTILPSFAETTAEVDMLKKEFNTTNNDIMNLRNELNNLKLVVSQNQEIDKNNTQKIINLIENIAKRLDKQSLKVKKVNNNNFKKWSLNKIFASALNDYRKNRFSLSYDKFYYLYQKKYKLSESLFYLGEINYKKAHYKTALAFYKKSILNMKKTTYFTDDLLYHTGYAFEKLKNYDGAKKSYLKLIHDFPKSTLAKYAKKRLENLEKIK